MIENTLEAFLAENRQLAPDAQRRASAAGYTPGEDIVGPLLRRPDGFARIQHDPPSQTQERPSNSSPAPLSSLLGRQPATASNEPARPSTDNDDEDIQLVPLLPHREPLNLRLLTSSDARQRAMTATLTR